MGWESTVRSAAAHGWNSGDLSADDLREAVAALDAARAEVERLRTADADERADVVADARQRARKYDAHLELETATAFDIFADRVERGAHVGAAKGGE